MRFQGLLSKTGWGFFHYRETGDKAVFSVEPYYNNREGIEPVKNDEFKRQVKKYWPDAVIKEYPVAHEPLLKYLSVTIGKEI